MTEEPEKLHEIEKLAIAREELEPEAIGGRLLRDEAAMKAADQSGVPVLCSGEQTGTVRTNTMPPIPVRERIEEIEEIEES